MAQESFVRDLPGLVAALQARGENVTVFDDAAVVFGTTDGIESAVQLIWSAERGALHVVEVYRALTPYARKQELFDSVIFANTRVNMPAFQVRKVEGGFKVAFSTCGFLDHEGRLSTRAAMELIKQVRLAGVEMMAAMFAIMADKPKAAEAAAAPTPMTTREDDEKAYAAFAARAREKLTKVPPPVTFQPVTPAERQAIQAAFQRECPRFARRVPTAQIEDYGHPFFKKVRVLRLAAADFPAEAAFVAMCSFGPVVLSGNPPGLVAMCADEKPAYADDPDLAIVLANMAAAWTGASLMSFLQVASVDDIPFSPTAPEDPGSETAIRRRFADRIHPPRVETFPGGARVTMWIVSESKLRLRVAEVRPHAVLVTEDVVADVAVPPGRGWAMRGNRLIPIA